MSHTTTMLELSQTTGEKTSDTSLTTIVTAVFDSTRASSGSLESNASTSASTGTSSQSVPSLDTSHSTSSSIASSAASSTTPSPCPSILRCHSSHTLPSAHTLSRENSTSGSPSPNVTFAPLPRIEPRKRNSSHPLGVAARSRLLRHRRMLREGVNPEDDQYHQYGPGSGVAGGRSFDEPFPTGLDGGFEGREDVDEDGGVRSSRNRTTSDAEDPIISLGKLVKGAGKTLWKSLSMRDMRPKETGKSRAEPGPDQEEGGGQGEHVRSGSQKGRRRGASRKDTVHLFEDDGQPHSEKGGVWEEEIPEESWKKLISMNADASEPSDKIASGQGDKDSLPRSSVERSTNSSTRTITIEGPAKAR